MYYPPIPFFDHKLCGRAFVCFSSGCSLLPPGKSTAVHRFNCFSSLVVPQPESLWSSCSISLPLLPLCVFLNRHHYFQRPHHFSPHRHSSVLLLLRLLFCGMLKPALVQRRRGLRLSVSLVLVLPLSHISVLSVSCPLL